MKTSFKKAMKYFEKSSPGISYLTHEKYLSGGGGAVSTGGLPGGLCFGGLCPDTWKRPLSELKHVKGKNIHFYCK